MPGMAGAMASGDPMGALYGLGARPPLSVRDMDSASTLLANPVLRKVRLGLQAPRSSARMLCGGITHPPPVPRRARRAS